MEIKTEYSLTYSKKISRDSHHIRMTKTRPTLFEITCYYNDLMNWGKGVPEMELTIIKLVKRTYTEESLLPIK